MRFILNVSLDSMMTASILNWKQLHPTQQRFNNVTQNIYYKNIERKAFKRWLIMTHKRDFQQKNEKQRVNLSLVYLFIYI